jgi:hypothetical protein
MAQGRIEGRVVNGTSSQTVANQVVELLLPRGGMQQIATATTDSAGRFSFAGSDVDPVSFYLLQVVFQGVNYHAPVQFDSAGTARADLTVYDATRSRPELRIQSARIVIRAEGQKVGVQELFALRNPTQPPRTYVNPGGTFHFRLGASAGEPTAAVAGELNMPLPQEVQKGKSPGDFYIDYALKPGITGIMVAYDADYSAGEFTLRDRVGYPIERLELQVSPSSLSLDSSIFKSGGVDTLNGVEKFEAERLSTDAPLEARLSGEAAPSSPAEAGQGEEQVKVVPASMTRLGVPLLACFLLVLLWALGVRTAKEWTPWKDRCPASPVQKQLEARMEGLLDSLADLDELFAAGKVEEKYYWKERLELKAKLVAILKKKPSRLDSYATRTVPR